MSSDAPEGTRDGASTVIARIEVAGEVFVVSERDGQFHYDWVGGRHHGDYGFVSLPSAGAPPETVEGHRAAITAFLADINPETGHLD